jgi:glycine betaine transporter
VFGSGRDSKVLAVGVIVFLTVCFVLSAVSGTTGAVAAVLLWAGGLKALQTLVILVAGLFMLVLIAMCLSTLKSLREEPYESTLPPRVRRAVLHAQRHDRLQHQTIVLATLGCEGPDDGEVSISALPKGESPKVVT